MSPAQNIRIFSRPLYLIGNLLFTDHIKLITLSVDKNLLTQILMIGIAAVAVHKGKK